MYLHIYVLLHVMEKYFAKINEQINSLTSYAKIESVYRYYTYSIIWNYVT